MTFINSQVLPKNMRGFSCIQCWSWCGSLRHVRAGMRPTAADGAGWEHSFLLMSPIPSLGAGGQSPEYPSSLAMIEVWESRNPVSQKFSSFWLSCDKAVHQKKVRDQIQIQWVGQYTHPLFGRTCTVMRKGMSLKTWSIGVSLKVTYHNHPVFHQKTVIF